MIRCKIVLHDIGNTCPICGEQALDAAFDEHEDGEHLDTFKCDHCGVLVTYISTDDGRGEYHQYHDGEITVEFEWPVYHMKPEDTVMAFIESVMTYEKGDFFEEELEPFLVGIADRARKLHAELSSDNPPSED